MKPKISIVIPSMRHLDDCLRPCLDSIKTQTDLTDVECVVVLNGCGDDGSRECVDSLGAPFRYVWLDEPSGYTHSTNVGIHAAQGEFIILLNNDCVVLGPQWIDLLLQPFSDPTVGITGPLMLHCPDADEDFLVFFCAMISRQCLDAIGGQLDEVYSPGYGEDCAAACEARRAGFKVVRVPEGSELRLIDKGCEDLPEWKRDKMWHAEFPLYHDGNKTFGDEPEVFDVVLNRNKKTLQERYGNKVNTPDGNCAKHGSLMLDEICIDCEREDGIDIFEASVTDGWFSVAECSQLARWVKALPPYSTVVEIGSWHGRSSRAIAANLSYGSRLFCVDTFTGSSGEPEQHATAKLREGDHCFSWWLCNLWKYILEGKVIPIRAHSENAAETLDHLQLKIDLLFVDADHSVEGFKTDILKWAPMMKDGALWCGHDYYPEGEEPFAWIGVRQGVQELFPDAQKVSTSLWYSRSKPRLNSHQAELAYQVNEAHFDMEADPEYAAVVEKSQREIVGKLFGDVSKNAKILDAGCGNGITISILRESGFAHVDGVDLTDSPLAPMAIKWDMHDLPYPDDRYDIIYCSHALEHAYDPLKALAEFKRVLKPDGQLFLVLPFPDYIDSEHRAKAHCGSEILGLTAKDGVKTLLSIIEGTGFDSTYREQGNLRGEPEIYLAFKPHRSHVYDAFIFNDELDLLEMRFATLYDTVDKFVICEGTQTHSGQPKSLHFDENKERFAQYLNKVIHVVVDDYPEVGGDIYNQAWTRERWQRDSIRHGLTNCAPDDIVILGDADEIANPEVVAAYRVEQGLCRLKQRLFYYYLNCENKEGWDWLKIAPYSMVKELTPCGIRYPPAGHVPLIENGGWHFSFLGDAANAIKKVADYAHREFDTPELMNVERVTKLIESGEDIFGRGDKYEFVEIDDNYPQYVKDNRIDLYKRGLIKSVQPPPSREAMESMLEMAQRVKEITKHNVVSFDRPSRLGAKKHWTVTAEVSTKDRYHVLPACLTAIITQTRKPDKLVIYDDGEQLDLREVSPFKGLFQMCDERGIKWEIFATPRKGQVTNHQHCLDQADTDFIFRVDDDEIPMPDCLERLLHTIRDYGIGGDIDNIGAVGGLVLNPAGIGDMPPFLDGSLKDVQAGLNLAWYKWNGGPREVQHLYSTFLLRVDHARKVGGYPRNLSPVGHHEESIMTHLLHRAGFKVIINPVAVTYHLREATGGIRTFSDHSLWDHDEQVWQSYLQEWGAGSGKPTKLIVLDAGIGDHFAFKSILPKLREIHADKELVLSVCFPAVFEGEGLKLISIADAKTMLGDRYEETTHLYRHLWEKGSTLPLAEAMLEFWG